MELLVVTLVDLLRHISSDTLFNKFAPIFFIAIRSVLINRQTGIIGGYYLSSTTLQKYQEERLLSKALPVGVIIWTKVP